MINYFILSIICVLHIIPFGVSAISSIKDLVIVYFYRNYTKVLSVVIHLKFGIRKLTMTFATSLEAMT